HEACSSRSVHLRSRVARSPGLVSPRRDRTERGARAVFRPPWTAAIGSIPPGRGTSLVAEIFAHEHAWSVGIPRLFVLDSPGSLARARGRPRRLQEHTATRHQPGASRATTGR